MELDSDVNSPTDKHRLDSNAKFRSDEGKINIGREHAARRNKEYKKPEDEEGDGRRGTAESAFAKAHHLGLADLVGYVACRFTSTLPNDKVFPLTKSRRHRSS